MKCPLCSGELWRTARKYFCATCGEEIAPQVIVMLARLEKVESTIDGIVKLMLNRYEREELNVDSGKDGKSKESS